MLLPHGCNKAQVSLLQHPGLPPPLSRNPVDPVYYM
jgi:hypothetical protein